jgi:uncharacterized 2Fe-2S/4Fe-4S cluster protein (DUF4445 family)
MNIRCGTRAAPGAIEDVVIDSQSVVHLQVIGNLFPSGICGSGILAAIKELLRVKLIRSDGSLLSEEELSSDLRRFAALCCIEDGVPAIRLSEQVVVTQKDIRHVQLAKGALLSGIRALLIWAELEEKNIDKVFVAGQFGAHLSVENLTGCGILPIELGGKDEKIEYIGNSSKEGARRALLSLSEREEMEKLARSVTYLDLGSTPGFEELFLQSLAFPQR